MIDFNYRGKIMERTFLIYSFNGIVLHLCTSDRVKKMSLADCLKNVYNTYYDNNTKRFFNSHNFDFTLHELTIDQINEKITDGWALFPISEKTDIEEVKRYIDLGLYPVFIHAKDLRTLRKALG